MSFKQTRTRVLIVLFAAVAAACGGGGSSSSTPPITPPTQPPGVATQYVVAVQATDPSISTAFGSNHYAYINSSVAPKGKLFLFFGATASQPQNYTLIGTAAANAGFHSLGLAYPNGPSPVDILCQGSTDPNCTGKIREETFTGTDLTPLVTVDVSNSVQNRLVKALLYLAAQHPADNWGQYLDSNNNVLWNRIRVSGLSQGGGLAGYIGKLKETVDRVCFFSSPADWDDVNAQPAYWVLNGPSLTNANFVYGFNSLNDPIVPYPHILKTWTAFGMDAFGQPVSVDTTQNYTTHELNTAIVTGNSAHTSTASDSQTPLDANGVPIYLGVWTYACFN